MFYGCCIKTSVKIWIKIPPLCTTTKKSFNHVQPSTLHLHAIAMSWQTQGIANRFAKQMSKFWQILGDGGKPECFGQGEFGERGESMVKKNPSNDTRFHRKYMLQPIQLLCWRLCYANFLNICTYPTFRFLSWCTIFTSAACFVDHQTGSFSFLTKELVVLYQQPALDLVIKFNHSFWPKC